MIIKLADNIYSPLGTTTLANFESVVEGRSALRQYALPNGSRHVASLFPEKMRKDDVDFTFFERLCILSASDAIDRAGINPSSPSVRFFIASTKGNVHLLAKGEIERALPGSSADLICRHFGNPNPPFVISNACISGLSAQIIAMRTIEAGLCNTAVVIGCDIQSDFIISGFQCLHALSPDRCRPFDRDRCGLNLGEAAATIVYSTDFQTSPEFKWVIKAGAMCNDANHISGPSRTGEGSFRCLQALSLDANKLAFVSVHGTSTLYNDEMESIAIERAGLSDVPIFSLKGIYGHTMGAAGILETILSMQAIAHGMIPGTPGFEKIGVSGKINVCSHSRTTDRHSFVKLMSGFGGCNAAIRFDYITLESKSDTVNSFNSRLEPSGPNSPIHSVLLNPSSYTIDGRHFKMAESGSTALIELYRDQVGNYPKFFKMDPLARVGFIASELLLKVSPKENYSVLLFNATSSVADDIAFQGTIQDPTNWFPSPSLFVYTLPNIVTGEIAIRNHFLTETNFMVHAEGIKYSALAEQIALTAQYGPVLAGCIDCWDKDHFNAMMFTVPQDTDIMTITQEFLKIKK